MVDTQWSKETWFTLKLEFRKQILEAGKYEIVFLSMFMFLYDILYDISWMSSMDVGLIDQTMLKH